jgi:hypothetical protein
MKTTLPLLTFALCFIGCSGSQGGGNGGSNPPPRMLSYLVRTRRF